MNISLVGTAKEASCNTLKCVYKFLIHIDYYHDFLNFCSLIVSCLFRSMEKMISGMYMGEIVRLVLVRLSHENLLFTSVDRDCNLFERGRFYTKYVSEIER